MRRWLRLGPILSTALLVAACRSGEEQTDAGPPVVTKDQKQDPDREPGSDQKQGQHDPLGPNAACYVCHMTFVREELSAVHLDEEIGCIQCHGLSDGHANDENIGATPPDKVFERDQINPFCRSCHETHDVAPAEVVARWIQRSPPKTASQPVTQVAVCTDCHGHHTIDGN